MARYIDAEDLLNNLNKFAPESFNALINSLILKQPTADVQEVKHGEWFLRHLGAGHYWECSECAFQLTTPRGNYCPNCGAKMDKE